MLLSEDFLQPYRSLQPNWGFNGLGEIVYKRTYSRVKENGEKETWVDTLQRCVEGAQEIGAGYTEDEAKRLFDYMFHLKGLFGGRFLWQLGTETVKRYGKSSLVNCWFVPINSIDSFCFLYDMLLMGGGVGYSVKQTDVGELPRVKRHVKITHELTKDADFIVSDRREGWIELLRRTLQAFLITGKSFTYSTILVRGAGEPIRGFGGTASGPLPLITGIQQIVEILQQRAGKKLRSVDALDICNILGSIVVAGNVRRSAQIALGNADDVLFLRAKNWGMGNIPNWRAMSNNTIYADDFEYLNDEFWRGYAGDSENYGLFNLALSQRKGRTKDPDIVDNCEGVNPCGEITLAPFESCVLSEIFLPHIQSQEELNDIVRLLYKTVKATAALPSHWKQVNEICAKNMRIAPGMGGLLQATEKWKWLDSCYESLRTFDKEWSRQRGWPESIKLSTVKPSGTISLLAGVTPGIHPAYARYYIRRVRMSTNDLLVEQCREKGYHVEYVQGFDGKPDYTTVVVNFPCFAGEDTIIAENVNALQQLDYVKEIQRIWSDNAVSCTVYYKPEELPDIRAWLAENYENHIKSVSFLRHANHGFNQAPYEEITREEYERMQAGITGGVLEFGNEILDLECENGVCPVR